MISPNLTGSYHSLRIVGASYRRLETAIWTICRCWIAADEAAVHGTYRKESLKYRWGRIGADSVPPRSGVNAHDRALFRLEAEDPPSRKRCNSNRRRLRLKSCQQVLYTEKYAIETKMDVATPLGGYSTCVLQGIVLLLQRS